MYHKRSRRFKRRSNGRNHSSRMNGGGPRLRHDLFSSSLPKNNFRTVHNPEKLFEKYSALAKEALSAGDKTLCENYLQHADHFIRIMEDRKRNQTINKIETTSSENNLNTSKDKDNDQKEDTNEKK